MELDWGDGLDCAVMNNLYRVQKAHYPILSPIAQLSQVFI